MNNKLKANQVANAKNYSGKQLGERFYDVEMLAYFLARTKDEKQTNPKPCEGYGHCCFYGEWDCDSCIATNKIYEYFKNKKPLIAEIKKN